MTARCLPLCAVVSDEWWCWVFIYRVQRTVTESKWRLVAWPFHTINSTGLGPHHRLLEELGCLLSTTGPLTAKLLVFQTLCCSMISLHHHFLSSDPCQKTFLFGWSFGQNSFRRMKSVSYLLTFCTFLNYYTSVQTFSFNLLWFNAALTLTHFCFCWWVLVVCVSV